MWKFVITEEKVVNIAFAWDFKVLVPVDSCKLSVRSLSTPVSKTFKITAVHSYRCIKALLSGLGGKTLINSDTSLWIINRRKYSVLI